MLPKSKRTVLSDVSVETSYIEPVFELSPKWVA